MTDFLINQTSFIFGYSRLLFKSNNSAQICIYFCPDLNMVSAPYINIINKFNIAYSESSSCNSRAEPFYKFLALLPRLIAIAF